MKPLILFDFDGTLVDSVTAMVETINEVAQNHGYEGAMTRDSIREMSSQQLIKHFGIPFWKVPLFLEEYKQVFMERVQNVQMYPGMKDLLLRINKRARIGIVSTNDPEFIKTFLGRQGVRHVFSAVDGGAFFAKNLRIAALTRKFEVLTKHVLYVGDETRDVHSSRRARVTSVAVTWGLQSEQVLAKVRPNMIARSVAELEKEITAWLDRH